MKSWISFFGLLNCVRCLKRRLKWPTVKTEAQAQLACLTAVIVCSFVFAFLTSKGFFLHLILCIPNVIVTLILVCGDLNKRQTRVFPIRFVRQRSGFRFNVTIVFEC